MNCTLRLSSTMTRLDHNRNARARRAKSRLATPLWAGKSRANAAASLRGQQGEPARGEVAEFWAAQSAEFSWSTLAFLHTIGQRLPLLVAALFGSCVGVFIRCQGSSASGQQAA